MSELSVLGEAADPADQIVEQLCEAVRQLDRPDAVDLLARQEDRLVAAVLQRLGPATAQDLLEAMAPRRRQFVYAAADPAARSQWLVNQAFPPDSIGRLMDPPVGLFHGDMTVAQAIEELRTLVRGTMVTYGYVVNAAGQLQGVLVMRDLLLAAPDQRLDSLMIANPFRLQPRMSLLEAMKAVLDKHYPVYPVCEDGRVVGLLRGQTLFEKQAIEISAQPGQMVGVGKGERLATPWLRSLRHRHPWLQLNLLTAFVAAAVVGAFEETIGRFVLLAAFLPVLAGQSANTGCQSLAVALRAITLGELKPGRGRRAVVKEALLGLANGALVGVVAACAMYIYARAQGEASPGTMAAIVLAAMAGACTLSCTFGMLVPQVLRRLGADPATASSIFLTTVTDVAGMGLFLGLATLLL